LRVRSAAAARRTVPGMSTASDPLKELRSAGWLVLAAGVISVLAGILALVYPDVTLLALAIFAGINVIVLSVLRIADAFSADVDGTGRTLAAIVGILGLIAGIVILRRPGESLLALLLILGVWLIVTGVIDFFQALATATDRALRMLVGIADIILGILILSLPGLSLATLAVLVGIAFIVRGALAVYAGWQLRKAAPPPVDRAGPLPAT
jgi:uncharacterized membrane protein HdeD (DUF308 family)